jgi:DNA-binding CsgD family transcriptional regulator
VAANQGFVVALMATHVRSLNVEGHRYKLIAYRIRRPSRFVALTPAELSVATAVVEGASTRELARRRGVSERTVANQLASIYRKLEVCSRHELVAAVFGERGPLGGVECESDRA